MSLDVAVKEFVLHCLSEPDVLSVIKEGLYKEKESPKENTVDKEIWTDEYINDDNLYRKKLQFGEEEFDNIELRLGDIALRLSNLEKSLQEVNNIGKALEVLIKREDEKNNELIKYYESQIESLLNEKELCDQTICSLEDKISYVEDANRPFENQKTIWDKLVSLDEEKKEYLSKLCGDFSVDACLSLGREVNKIGQLWLFLKDEVFKEAQRSNSTDALITYFDFCVGVAISCQNGDSNITFDEHVKVGCDYDKTFCIRTPDSKQIGKVSEVITRCVKTNERILYKAIVRVD